MVRKMNKKIMYIGFISIILLVSFEAGSAIPFSDLREPWIRITTPKEGDMVTMPLEIQSEGSSDIDLVAYYFYADWNGNGNYYYKHHYEWTSNETPYNLTVHFDLLDGSTLTIFASAYKIIGQTTLKIAEARNVTVTIVKPSITDRNI